ncbi:MAG: dienelactone hydrolase family protein [Desulfobacteraceae bacterium]|nr:dienelactone hydrolase family protein [Desulfobacteraceae bacterium]
MPRILFASILPLAFAQAAPATAAVQGEETVYRAGATPLKGYFAWDGAVKGRRPGILVVHEWWGHDEHARKRARMLAGLGYTALALDMYGEGRQAVHPAEARTFAAAVRENLPLATERFNAALALLRGHPTVDPGQTAAIGYCFGGGIALAMARTGADLAGVVSFHGSLATGAPAKPGAVKAKILVLTGGADSMVPPEQVSAFEREMDAARADYRTIVYPGAKHSFTNPQADALGRKFNIPIAYDPEADRQSWQAMREFFEKLFKGGNRPRDSRP